MTYLDFTPLVDGEPYDPVDNGGSVGALVLYELLGDTFTPAATVPSPTKLDTAQYRYTLPATLVESRYWPGVTWAATGGDTPAEEKLASVTLPGWEATGRVVAPWDVAVHLGLALPLNDLQTVRIVAAIDRAQAKVGDYLNRLLLPEQQTFTKRSPVVGYEVTDPNAWPDIKREADDIITVVSATMSDFTYTVVVDVGLNVATDPQLAAIRDWVVKDAAGQLVSATGDGRIGTREVTSVSADGQSVSYQQGGAQAAGETGMAGGVPEIRALRRWRRRSVFQRRTYATPPWPYQWTP